MFSGILSINQKDCVFFELPQGKIGKDGTIKVQKGQKGHTCMFYAMKKLLTLGQIRSPHGQTCSTWRKLLTQSSANADNLSEFYEGNAKAHRAFFATMGLDPKVEANEFWLETMKQGMTEVPAEYLTREVLEEQLERAKPLIQAAKPWFELACLEAAACQRAAQEHGLEEVPCANFNTFKSLKESLRKCGPLMVMGRFGSMFYGDVEAVFMGLEVADHPLYGWKKGTPSTPGMGINHAIVIIGAEKKLSKEFIYWIDPKDDNVPGSGQRIFISTFQSFSSRLTTIRGTDLAQVVGPSKAIMGIAYYNPLLSQYFNEAEQKSDKDFSDEEGPIQEIGQLSLVQHEEVEPETYKRILKEECVKAISLQQMKKLSQLFLEIQDNLEQKEITPFASSLLFAAVEKEDEDTLTYLVHILSADVNASNAQGVNPLIMAAYNGKKEAVNYLANLGADLDYAIPQGHTALHIACIKGHSAIAQALVEKGADTKLLTTDGMTARDLALLHGHMDLFHFFRNK